MTLDVAALRTWGLVFGAAALSSALSIALVAHAELEPAPAERLTPLPEAAAGPHPGFVVRFAPSHPLGAAEEIAVSGNLPDAERAVRIALARDPALAGLCFDRFTRGAALVLAACEDVTDRRSFEARWRARFAQMRDAPRVEALP